MYKPTLPYDSQIMSLKYPKDAKRIGRLSLEYFQAWYLAQEPREMVYLGQFKEFKSFVFWNYTIYVKGLRLWYKLKNFFKAPKYV